MYSFFIQRVILSLIRAAIQQFLLHSLRAWPRPFMIAINHTAHDSPPPLHGATVPSGPRPPQYRGFTITLRRTTLGRASRDEWSVRRRDLYLTTHDTHETDFHALGGIRKRNPSIRAAAVPHLRPRGHWDRPSHDYPDENIDIWLGCSGHAD